MTFRNHIESSAELNPRRESGQNEGIGSSDRLGNPEHYRDLTIPSPEPEIVYQYSATFDDQPPAELRPNIDFPELIVRMHIGGPGTEGKESPLDPNGAINALAYIVSPDGHSLLPNQPPLMPQNLGFPISTMATAPERHEILGEDTSWTLRVKVRANNRTGFYRLRVNIFYTPVDDDGEAGSPIQLDRAMWVTVSLLSLPKACLLISGKATNAARCQRSRVIHFHYGAPLSNHYL